MANTHQKLGTAGAFGHDAQPEVGHQVRGRNNAGGKLHRRGQKRKPIVASPTVAKAVVVHLEKTEAALEAKIAAGLARANAMVKGARAAETTRVLEAARQGRRDIVGIIHVPNTAARHARIAAEIAAHC